MSDTDDIDDFLATLSTESAKAVPAKAVPKPKAVPPLSGGSPNLLGMVVASNDDDGDDIAAFLETTGLKADREVPDAAKPWMKYHKFTRVETIEEVNRIVNECIDRGTCSLDLETTGLDNRIIYKNGKPETVDQIVGFCISYDGYEGFYIPIRHKPADRGPSLNVEPVVEVERAITRLCLAAIPEGTAEDKVADSLSYKGVAQVVLFFWNAQFDHEFLYPVTGIDWWHPSSFEDGMLASFVKYAGDKGIGLKPKAKQLLIDPDGNPYEMIELKQLFQKGMPIRFDSLSPDEPGVIRYGGSDGICTYKLCTIPDLVPLCNAKYNFTYRLEKQLTCVLRVLERNRVRINRAPVRAMLEAKSKERDEILAKIRKFAKLKNTDLDPNSPKQLGEFLFGTGSNCMNITPKPAKNEASGQYKTDGATLEALAEEPNAPSILKDVVTYRGFEKSIGTYLIGLANNPDSNDELRVSFKQTGASTGRFSAPAGDPEHGYSGIPIHGIPQGSDLRRVFEARPGYTMAKCDYAGEELRIAANVSGETVWINEFMQGSGDLHTITARAFFGKQEVTKDERNAGKTANFALLYGGGPKSIIRATGCNEVEARRRKQAFDKAVPTFAKWIKQQHAAVKINLGVWTAFGRWLLIPDANSQEGEIRAACERHSVNFQIQGAGADIMKIAMVLLHKAFHNKGWLRNGGDDSVRMLLTVHDEIVFEIKHERVVEVIPLIVEIMEGPWKRPKNPPWKVPLVVEPLVGFNWSSGYKVERHKKGQALGKGEVLANGYVYGTTRKPAKEYEQPDIGEIVLTPNKLFGLEHTPPWLASLVPSAEVIETPVIEAVQEPPTQEAVQEAVQGTIQTQEAVQEVQPQEAVQEPPTQDVPLESLSDLSEALLQVAEPQHTAPPEKLTQFPEPQTDGVIVFGIDRLNEQTAAQISDFVCIAMLEARRDGHGSILHLQDFGGETLIPISYNYRIQVSKFAELLRRHNLLVDK